jgi:hypothetical protein
MVEGTCPSLSLVGGFILVASYGTGHVNVRAIQILEEWDTGVTPSLKPARKIWAFFQLVSAPKTFSLQKEVGPK